MTATSQRYKAAKYFRTLRVQGKPLPSNVFLVISDRVTDRVIEVFDNDEGNLSVRCERAGEIKLNHLLEVEVTN